MTAPSHKVQAAAYEAVIGVEVHVQLATKSKIFCGCAVQPLAEPNTHICEVCSGQPGTLPVLNQQVVEYAIMAGLATNCTISPRSEFSRKHYFYPDLPKNYQITQDNLPIATKGYLDIVVGGVSKRIRIRRIHIEEDAGKSIHASHGDVSFVDLNRAGTPLLEIVTEPDLSSAEEVRAYLKTLHGIVTTLAISSGNMEEGAFRADTNVSVRLRGATELGTRCELKNINSFKFIGDAVLFEIARQIELIESGEKVTQQTRLWDTKNRVTTPMRSKEEAADYRYMPEPDLFPLLVTAEHIAQVRERLPELPAAKAVRLMAAYGLSSADAEIIAQDADLARYFEDAAAKSTNAKMTGGWIVRELLAHLKESGTEINAYPVAAPLFAELVNLIDAGTINARTAQELLVVMHERPVSPRVLVQERGLEAVSDEAELTKTLQGILDAYPDKVAEYRAGREKLWGLFIGEAMKATKGRAQPQVLNDLLRKLLQK